MQSSKKVLRGESARKVSGILFETFVEKPVNYHKDVVSESPPELPHTNEPQASAHDIRDAVSQETRKMRHELEAAFKGRLQEAQAAARDESAKEFQKAIDLLANYAKLLSMEKMEVVSRYEKEVLDLAFEIAGKILGGELAERPESIVHVARSALQQVIDCQKIKVRANPNDVKHLQTLRADLAGQLSQDARIELISDAAIASGGCVIDTEKGSLDARIGSQLETMKSNLTTRSGG
jgi:flagellar assembly protein FliH